MEQHTSPAPQAGELNFAIPFVAIVLSDREASIAEFFGDPSCILTHMCVDNTCVVCMCVYPKCASRPGGGGVLQARTPISASMPVHLCIDGHAAMLEVRSSAEGM